MIVVEVLGSLVVLIMAIAVTWMAIVGLVGATGVVCLKRCRFCGHLHPAWTGTNPPMCAYCRHPWLNRHVMPVRLHHFFPAEMDPVRAGARTGSEVASPGHRAAP
jgi:hypothetical protein